MERPLQRRQEGEGLNMLLGITQAREDASGASGTPRGTMQILIEVLRHREHYHYV